MKNIITLGGSNSKNSISKALAEYVGSLLTNYNVQNIDLNHYEMPLFSVDSESEEGFPKSAIALSKVMENADGFVIALAEHNGAYSAAFKNMFDWLSRIEGNIWREKPMILLSTSPGARGGASVLEIALSRFPRHAAHIVGSLAVPYFDKNFQEGKISNDELQIEILELIAQFKKSL